MAKVAAASGIDLDAVLHDPPGDNLPPVDDALQAFAYEDPAGAELVCPRVFAGLTLGEAAEVMGISRTQPIAPLAL